MKATAALTKYIKRFRTAFANLSARQTALLEIGAITITAEHYRRIGYDVHTRGLQGGFFRVKVGTSGWPWNFSWFECTRDGVSVEVHGNLPVYGAYGGDWGRYTVDVAVIRRGALPTERAGRKDWVGLANKHLVSFVEAKKLVIYPMLLAQFIGIVHEIQPRFLRNDVPRRFRPDGHFFPALVSVGYLHGQSRAIVDHFPRRGFRVCICASFEIELARLRGDVERASPFAIATDESRAVRKR